MMKCTGGRKIFCGTDENGVQVLRVISEDECSGYLNPRNANDVLTIDIRGMNKILEKHRLSDSNPHSGGDTDV